MPVKTAFDFKEITWDLLGGLDSLDNPADIKQTPTQDQIGTLDPRVPLRMVQANDVWAPNDRYDLQTRPGFSEVRSTTINAAGIVTGMAHQGAIADRWILVVSILGTSHNIYQDSANPPAAIAGGTNFTIGQDQLATLLNFSDGTNAGTIIFTLARDLPQFINSSGARSNFTIAGTGLTSLKPAIGEIFGQRALYANVDFDGTVHFNRVYWSDIRDGNLITDPTTQFESFERRTADQIRGVRVISDFCLVGSRDYLTLLGLTPNSDKPFGLQDVPIGAGEGPISHQGMIAAGRQRVAWMAQNGIFSLEGSQGEVTKDWTGFIRPFISGLSESRREFAVAGYDPKTEIGLWSVSESGQSTHNKVLGVNFRTGEIYIWTLSRNAFATRIVSGEQRLIGGGYVGKFYNEIQTSVFTGNADDATTAIDADIFTPRFHCGAPNYVKLFAGIKVIFDPQATSEAVTVNYRLNDNSTWSSFGDSPYTVSGTANDVDMRYFKLMKAGTHLQIRLRDANSGQNFRVQKIIVVYKFLHVGLVSH